MTRIQKDDAHVEQTLDDTQSLTLELESDGADTASLLVDSGTSGTQAATYDVTLEVYVPAFDDWMVLSSESGTTALFHTDTPEGTRIRYEITNANGTTGDTYRARAVTYTTLPKR